MKGSLQDRVIVVTGASRGLGKQIVLRCCERGARVALIARSGPELETTAVEAQRLGGDAKVWLLDVCDAKAVARAVKEVIAAWGRIDILVNAAGAKTEGAIEDITRDEVLRVLEVNCLGPLTLCQAVLPHMRSRGAGHVVNVSSVLGKRATPLRGAYSASKAALNAWTDSLRSEVAGKGIQVTLVCPGRLGADGGFLNSSEESAATAIVRCMEKPRRELVLTLAGRVLVCLNALAPGLVDWVVTKWRKVEQRP